ncbi:MAG TPA: hypothetical protein VKU84_01815 [Stellaceae bacterium]|nr:hypothetical protein [Stellaceae bacterium]
MNTNSNLIDAIAKTLGLARTHVAAIADVIGTDTSAPASITAGVDLVIASLAAATPEEAPRRLELYRALPLTHGQWLNVPRPDGGLATWAVAIEDFPIPPGDGPRLARLARSFGDALAQFIEQRIAGGPEFFGTPYMIKVARRDTAPLAFIGIMATNRAEEVLLYRHTEDSEQGYTLASYRLTLFADAHGHVLDAIADLFRGDKHQGAQEPAASVAAEGRAHA